MCVRIEEQRERERNREKEKSSYMIPKTPKYLQRNLKDLIIFSRPYWIRYNKSQKTIGNVGICEYTYINIHQKGVRRNDKPSIFLFLKSL